MIVLRWIALAAMLVGLALKGQAQVATLQAENAPTRLAATAALPNARSGAAALWHGYAHADSLAKISLGGGYGFGIENGNAFDLGFALRIKRITVSAWTSGLNKRMSDSLTPISILQRASVIQAQYQTGPWAFAASSRINYTSFNKDLEVTTFMPTLSAEYAWRKYRFGARFSNFLFAQTRVEGTIGESGDPSITDPAFAGNQKGPALLAVYTTGKVPVAGKLSVLPSLQAAAAFNYPAQFMTIGSKSTGMQLQGGLEVAYADRVSGSMGYRPASNSKLSQLTWGFQLKLQQLTVFYSSYNFYYFTPNRAHLIGAAVAIR